MEIQVDNDKLEAQDKYTICLVLAEIRKNLFKYLKKDYCKYI